MRNKTHYVRNKLVLGNRDREDKNYCIILFTCVSPYDNNSPIYMTQTNKGMDKGNEYPLT
jgi:hypothetical protein